MVNLYMYGFLRQSLMLLFLYFSGQRGSPDMIVSDPRIPNLTNLPVPVTSQQDAQLSLLPESRLDIGYPERSSLIQMFPRIPPPDRYSDRLPEPRPLNPTLSVPFPTTSSNLSILQESRVLSTVGNTGQSNTYPMLSSDIYSLNPQSQLSSSFTIPSSSQLSASLIGYSPLHPSAGQNLQNIHRASGEVVTYEILGGRTQEYMPQRSLDIPMRPLMSPSRLALENTHMREEEREMQANPSPLHGDSNVTQGHRSPPRGGRNTGDAGSVWRPY